MAGQLFLAGASGVIGRRLIPLLLADGWQITGMTRSEERSRQLSALGINMVIADAFDAEAVEAALEFSEPDVVMHQMTDLPEEVNLVDSAALERNARLRELGTATLIRAAERAGAQRIVAQSISFSYAPGPLPRREDDVLSGLLPGASASDLGVASLEAQVNESCLPSIILRYGRLYGPSTWTLKAKGNGSVHVDAAAHAAALASKSTAVGVFNIADDEGEIDITRARTELGWSPDFRINRTRAVR